jgi:hypothetical protein
MWSASASPNLCNTFANHVECQRIAQFMQNVETQSPYSMSNFTLASSFPVAKPLPDSMVACQKAPYLHRCSEIMDVWRWEPNLHPFSTYRTQNHPSLLGRLLRNGISEGSVCSAVLVKLRMFGGGNRMFILFPSIVPIIIYRALSAL